MRPEASIVFMNHSYNGDCSEFNANLMILSQCTENTEPYISYTSSAIRHDLLCSGVVYFTEVTVGATSVTMPLSQNNYNEGDDV